MRVSLINAGLHPEDAIGNCIINQARYFMEHGHRVRIYLLTPPARIAGEIEALTQVVTLKELMEQRHEHFLRSDLYLYHYGGRCELHETMRGIERGTVVFYYHNVTPPELWGTDVRREWLADGVAGSAVAHYADYVIADSPFNKQDLVDRLGYAPERIFVLPLAVNLSQFAPGERDAGLVERYGLQGQKVMAYVGRMAGNKRIDLLVEALAQVKRQAPNTKLLLVGDDKSDPAFRPIVAAARKLAAQLGVQEDVVWTGRVDDLAVHMRLADVYVTASLHEGFGVPLIEAMASGVPVVASRAGAMPWVLGEAGLICEPEDAGDLAEKALSVLDDPAMHQTLARRGFERVQVYSQERYEAGLTEILESVLASAPAGAGHSLGVAASPDAEGEETPEREAQRGPFAGLLLESLSDAAMAGSDVVPRDYEVRSGVPLVGPLIVWLRRNLTSHLREPYLDPALERQVSFNRRVAEWLDRATQMLSAGWGRRQELEARIKALELQVERLTERLEEDDSLPSRTDT
jgi:glycosyltransferase involved in cell wall biosynthesis